MPNLYLPNGSSHITAPTLGDITASKIEVSINNLYIDPTVGTQSGSIISQCGNFSGIREFLLYFGGNNLSVILGGTLTTIDSFANLFGANLLDSQTFDLTIETNGDYTLAVDGSTVATGNAVRGTQRTDGLLFMIGAAGATTTPGDTTGNLKLSSGNKIGDTYIYINDVLVRSYIMPSTGATVPESTNSQDGTLQAGTGGGADWEVLASANADPVAVDDQIIAAQDTVFNSTIDLDTNDTDADLDALSVTAETKTTTQAGSITIASDGSYSYTPAASFVGIDSVDYTVNDGNGGSDTGTLTIGVLPTGFTGVFLVDPLADPTALTGMAAGDLFASNDANFPVDQAGQILVGPGASDGDTFQTWFFDASTSTAYINNQTYDDTTVITDTTPPVITIAGYNNGDTINLTVGDSFTAPSATATDDTDGDISGDINVTNNVNVNAAGNYTVQYSVSDAAGNNTTATLNVVVAAAADTIPPVLSLIGLATVTLNVGDTFVDPGASWTDNIDGSGTVYTTTVFDNSAAGSTQLQYQYTDAAGNPSNIITRTLVFQESVTPPSQQTNVLSTGAMGRYIQRGSQWFKTRD